MKIENSESKGKRETHIYLKQHCHLCVLENKELELKAQIKAFTVTTFQKLSKVVILLHYFICQNK